MSHFLDRLNFFKKITDTFSGDHGIVTNEDRGWEDAYRARWQHDKIVRSTHGVNCTGSCSWKIYVKNGLVTWETQQTDYPRTRDDLPNHEPRGCARGASYSWYLYSANRVKYPMIRGRLIKLWRAALAVHKDPVAAWASIVEDPAKATEYKRQRGLGGFVRSTWDEVNPIIAAANVYTAKQYGPDRIYGFSPIPAMSMVSYAAGSRYLSLIGGACGSFYDWYCDLPPASPMVWGEQTDVPESADWYNSTFLMMWGSNVPQTRTPDAHFMTEVRYKGAKIAVVCPDYSEASKFADIWLHPKQGTDAAVAMAMGHVILREFYLDGKSDYFTDYVRTKTDFPYLVLLERRADGTYFNGRFLRASDLAGSAEQANNPEWKTLAFDENSDQLIVPNGSIGFRWGEKDGMVGKWNLEAKESLTGAETQLRLSVNEIRDEVVPVAFPYFGSTQHPHFSCTRHDPIQVRNVPAKKVKLADGSEALVATVYDLTLAQYGLDRGLGGGNVAKTYDDDVPYTPAWQEKITGTPREQIITVARQFAENADKTHGKSMIIIGAAMNHWYHMDMNYRGVINMLMMCGCVGQSGGGWSHYVGQEKLRPQTGWTALAFALDWHRPPRHMNSTSFFYIHSSQWRHEKLAMTEILSPLADPQQWRGTQIDYNVRSARMGWLPTAPHFDANPLQIAKDAAAAGKAPNAYLAENLKAGKVNFAFEDPDNPANFPRNLFVWRSNLLGSSGKGHEYFLKYLLGTTHGVQGKDLGEEGGEKPLEVKWRKGAEGKLDLLVTLDFRMSTTCMYSDIVLPTATWYEKNDLNTSDMHPFIHPLSAAVDPAWESRTDWDIFKGIAKAFSETCPGHLGVEKDIVALPTLHDTPTELAQPLTVKDWKKGECELIPGKTAPSLVVVERDYPNTYKKFTSVGPLLDKVGNGGKGITWNTEHEVEALATLNYTVLEEGVSKGRPRIDSDIDAAEMIMMLAPETNGHVAVKAWAALSKITGRDHTHLAIPKEHEKIRFRDIQAQPRKIISSPTWSGLEDEKVSYNAGYTNVHELIPWRTLTGRQQFYQDHPWMLGFGEAMCAYRPPVDMKTVEPIIGQKPNGNPEIVLNFITPHQKWGIHSTYTDNLLMLTLSRGGPIIWMSEIDAKKAGIEDNDWIEAYNLNGAIAARAVVSQRVPEGMSMMYHAQEKIVNTPGSEITGTRGGIHNSVTRTVLKPTHMIGGYAQQSYGFNYYGTVGANRDEFIIVRKMAKVDWLDDETPDNATVEAH
ncbi:nitrate reductase subunit alpha [Candidatus Competibacter phosphatis]|uniref:nitrate reductase (quinone) n=1 Tax=Candidatus Competibacter phosphatis TaxID=221280 RepID=A0ABX1TKA5_9GAMM|nr:nitrate reductase subunit alpha [Candidatus Competibacter phosphatis]NMQ19089.1 nitrate reductase subunit alpha [Candidatus Competibacter phosphatis]